MTRTCLQIVQEFCGNRGLVKPNTAVSSADIQIIQILSLLNEGGAQLARRYDWQRLNGEASFTTVAQADQGDIPTIIGASVRMRKIINDTIWNRTTREIVAGPLYAEERQARLALPASGPFSQYFIRNNHLYFDPIPAAGDTCYFEYLTHSWVISSDSLTRRDFFTADEDLPLFDDELLLADLKWRWREAKGLEYAESFNSFERLVLDAMTDDKTARRKKLDDMWQSWGNPCVNVPQGNWSLTQLG